MRLSFDTYTRQGFADEGIADVHVWTEKKGCAGLKVFFEPLKEKADLHKYPQENGLTLWLTHKDADILDGGQVAVAKGRIFFSSPGVKGRCGCGTSISFEEKTIDLSMAKIHAISEKLSTLPHIQQALNRGKPTKKT